MWRCKHRGWLHSCQMAALLEGHISFLVLKCLLSILMKWLLKWSLSRDFGQRLFSDGIYNELSPLRVIIPHRRDFRLRYIFPFTGNGSQEMTLYMKGQWQFRERAAGYTIWLLHIGDEKLIIFNQQSCQMYKWVQKIRNLVIEGDRNHLLWQQEIKNQHDTEI